jgi:excisionase family DNA binding protein
VSPHPDLPDDIAPSLSTAEVARLFRVSVPTIQRWVDAGHLKAWKTPGGHRRVDAASVQALRAGPAQAAGPVQVVVVDDNPDDRDLLEAIVHEALPGAAVALFDNAVQALVAIGRHAPAIVITDIVMPHMDGLEMIHQLCGHCEVTPQLLVVVSATLPRSSARARGMPADAVFMAKPLDAPRLVALLRQHAPSPPARSA